MSLVFLYPGQGSQRVGMGDGLFARFPRETALADAQLGYSISRLCLEDPDKVLGQTQYTQPALYVVDALSHLAKTADLGREPDFVAGHSLGEYVALFAAGVFDFSTGLKLVAERGRIMAQARGGGMAALIDIRAERVREIIDNFGFDDVDVANYNSPRQTVISGPAEDVGHIGKIFEEAGAKVMPLKVSGAFHSRLMNAAETEFRQFIAAQAFAPPRIPVIANSTALPYAADRIADTLCRQISSPVRWTESMRYLLDRQAAEFVEVGPGNVLTRLLAQVKAG